MKSLAEAGPCNAEIMPGNPRQQPGGDVLPATAAAQQPGEGSSLLPEGSMAEVEVVYMSAWTLRLTPAALEQEFWDGPSALRFLHNMDKFSPWVSIRKPAFPNLLSCPSLAS